MTIDTGSALSAVFAMPDITPYYNASTGYDYQAISNNGNAGCQSIWKPTGNCGFQIEYADGSSIEGELGSETYTLVGGHIQVRATLGRILAKTSIAWDSSIGGILGLGFGTLNAGTCTRRPCASSFPESVDMDAPPFGVCMDPTAGGHLDWPAVPSLRAQGGAINWIPLEPIAKDCSGDPVYDQFQVKVSSFGGTAWDGIAVLDTGSTLLVIPEDLYAIWAPALPAALLQTVATQCTGAGALITNTSTLPNLDIVFPATGLVLSWKPHDYLFAKGSNRYCLQVAVVSTVGFMLLGEAFQQGFYNVFDHAHKRIGLAPLATNGCVPDAENTTASYAVTRLTLQAASDLDLPGVFCWETLFWILIGSMFGVLLLACGVWVCCGKSADRRYA